MDTGTLIVSLGYQIEFIAFFWIALFLLSQIPTTTVTSLTGSLRAGTQFLLKDPHLNMTVFIWDMSVQKFFNLVEVIRRMYYHADVPDTRVYFIICFVEVMSYNITYEYKYLSSLIGVGIYASAPIIFDKLGWPDFGTEIRCLALSIYVMASPLKIFVLLAAGGYICIRNMRLIYKCKFLLWFVTMYMQEINFSGAILFYLAIYASVRFCRENDVAICKHCFTANKNTYRCGKCGKINQRAISTKTKMYNKFPKIFLLALLEDLGSFCGAPILGFEFFRHFEDSNYIDAFFIHSIPAICGYYFRQNSHILYIALLFMSSLYHAVFNITVIVSFDKNMKCNFANRCIHAYKVFQAYKVGRVKFNTLIAVYPGQEHWREIDFITPAMTGLPSNLASQLVLGCQFPGFEALGNSQVVCRWLLKVNSFILTTTVKQRINVFLDIINEIISNERRSHFVSAITSFMQDGDFKKIFGVSSTLLFQNKQGDSHEKLESIDDYLNNAEATADFVECISDSALTANVCKLFTFMGAYIFVDTEGKIPKYLYARMDKSILDMVRDGSHRLIPIMIRSLTSLVHDALKVSKTGSLEGVLINPTKDLVKLKREYEIAEAGLILEQGRLTRSKDYMISNSELFAILKKMDDLLIHCRRHKVNEKGIIELSNFVHDERIKLSLSNGTYRDQPIGFHIYGSGGAGKTALSNYILKTVFKVFAAQGILKCDPKYADISTIQMTGATKRDDITTNAHMGIIIDEFCTTKPDEKTGGELFARVLKMFSGIREPIEKAQMAAKGKVYYNHKAGVVISNNNLMRYRSFLAAPEAWYRRFISMYVKRHYDVVLPNGLNPVSVVFECYLTEEGKLQNHGAVVSKSQEYFTHTSDFQKELIRRVLKFYREIILPGMATLEAVDSRLMEFDRLYDEVQYEDQDYTSIFEPQDSEILEGLYRTELIGEDVPPDNIFSVDGNYNIFDVRTYKRQQFLHFVKGVQYHYDIIPILVLVQKEIADKLYLVYNWVFIFYPYIVCYFIPLGFYYPWVDGIRYFAILASDVFVFELACRMLLAWYIDTSNNELFSFLKGKFIYYRILAMQNAAKAMYTLTSSGALDPEEYARLASRAASDSILMLIKPNIDTTLLEKEMLFTKLGYIIGGMGIGGALYTIVYNYMCPNHLDEALIKRSVDGAVSRDELREYLAGQNMQPIRLQADQSKTTMWDTADTIFPYGSTNDTVLKLFENCIWELFKNGDPIGFGLAVHTNMVAFPAHFDFKKQDVLEFAKYGKSTKRELKMTNIDVFIRKGKDLAFVRTNFPLKTCFRHLAHKNISEYVHMIKEVNFLGHVHRPGELMSNGVYAYASDIHGQGLCGIVTSAVVGGKYVPIGLHRGIRSDGPIRNAKFSQNQVVPVSLLDVAAARTYFIGKDKYWHDFSEQVHKDTNIPMENTLHKHAILNYREFNNAEFVGTVPTLYNVTRGSVEGRTNPLIRFGEMLGYEMYENGQTKFVPADLRPKIVGGEYISPLDGYLSKINKVNETPIDVGFIEQCKDQFITYMLNKFRKNHDGKRLQPLDLDYVLAGDNTRRGINAINVKSSGGLTFRNKNADFISVNVDREVPGVPLPRDLNESVIACVKQYIEDAQKGDSPMMFFKVNLKAEGRKNGKAPRVFYGGELLQTVLDRMFFLPLLEMCKDAKIYDFCAVGINAMSGEWGEMFDDMASISSESNIFGATDIAGFDTQMLDIIQKVGYDINMSLAKEIASPEFCRVLSALLTNRVNTPLVFRDVVMFLPNTMTSGTVGTCEWNSMVLLFLLFVAFKNKYGLGENANDFFDHVRPKVFGDDNVYATDIPTFTPLAIQMELQKFGITVTSDSKGDCENRLTIKQNVTFLNRRCIDKFVDIYATRVKLSLAPIEDSSIIKMLSVLMPSDSPDQISDILFQLALEQVQYGKERYDKVCYLISKRIIPSLKEIEGISASFTKRPYESWIERMYFKADEITSEYLIDNE